MPGSLLNDTCQSGRRIITATLNDNLLHVAASLAFTTILAIVPLLTVTLSLMTAFPIFSEFESSLQQFLRQQFLPEEFAATVMQYLDEFVSKATSLSAIGGAFLLVTAILVIMSVDDALNDIWHVKRKRPFGQRFLIYWAVLSLGPIILGASLWASSSMVQQALLYDGANAILPWHAAASWLPFLISWLGCALLFVAVPNCKVGFVPALLGGMLSSFLFQLIKWGLGIYLANFPTYTLIYGAFSVLPTFLMWVYLSWLAFLFGAIIAANLPRQLTDNRIDVHAHHDKLCADT
jgi:membrane protein